MPGTTVLPRNGAQVRARRRDGGRWHKARVVAVRDDTCDLDFANYGVVEGVPPERIHGTDAPTRRRPAPASPLRKPRPRIRVRTAGHEPAEPYRGDRKVDKRLKDSIGWCATRGVHFQAYGPMGGTAEGGDRGAVGHAVLQDVAARYPERTPAQVAPSVPRPRRFWDGKPTRHRAR